MTKTRIPPTTTTRDGRPAGAIAAMLLIAVAACGGGSDGGTNPPPPPPPPPPAGPVVLAMATSSGNAQTGTVGIALASPLRVLATRNAQPASGVTVTWSTSGTGASLAPPTSVTDNQGIASAMWTLPQTAGPRNATAAVTNATGSPVLFTATATAGAAAKLAIVDGNNQTGEQSVLLTSPIRAKVTDQYDNAVAATSVTWTVISGGGSISTATSLTDAFGAAAASWTLGAALGAQTAQASKAGLTGSPLLFTATASAPTGTAAIIVGNDFFNPSARTVAPGTAVTWTWTNTGVVPHSVRSLGSPSFPSSLVLTGNGRTYTVTFTAPGVYNYDCEVHGAAMSGTITVQ